MGLRIGAVMVGLCCGLVASVALAAEPFADERIALALTPPEKAYVLGQMRLFVASIQTIADGLAHGDAAQAAEAAAARGAARNAHDPDFPASLNEKLPADWKQFGGSLRKGFDGLAQSLAQGEPQSQSLARLADLMRNCVSCHASYRVVESRE